MKEIKQSYINILTAILTLAVLGIIVFFTKKWLEMREKTKEQDAKITRLEKNLKESSNHTKTVITRMNKKLSQNPPKTISPPTEQENINVDEEEEDFNEALKSLMA